MYGSTSYNVGKRRQKHERVACVRVGKHGVWFRGRGRAARLSGFRGNDRREAAATTRGTGSDNGDAAVAEKAAEKAAAAAAANIQQGDREA